jgi:hypothetical protein
MNRLKPLLLLACVLTVSLAAGCGNACLRLADQICSCQPDDTSRASCQQQAREQEGIFSVGRDQERLCQQALDSNACDCEELMTPEGRQACGIAYTVAPPDSAGMAR